MLGRKLPWVFFADCISCRLNYSPGMTENAIYGSHYYYSRMAMSDRAYAMVACVRSGKMQPHVKPQDRVFEFGVGSGLAMAGLRCAARDGFDVNPAATIEAARHGITILNSIDGISSAYDVVICHHVLEHMNNPADCLATLRRLLRPNGKLLLFVPFEEQRRYRRHIADDPNHHLYSWTPHTLHNLVEDSGFAVHSAGLGHFGYDRVAAQIATRLHSGELGFRFLRRCGHIVRPEREIRIVASR